MVLNETYLGKWLSLIRIQSTPVTVITLCLGYVTVTQRLNYLEMIPLVIVGCLGHWGFYAQNDVIDYKYDIEHKSIDKPLVSEVVDKFHAQVVSSVLIAASVIVAILFFNIPATMWFIMSALVGLMYNLYSKRTSLSGLFLSYWGFSVVLAGATYAGYPNILTWILAIGIAVHMLTMTMMGDIKDIDAEEPSIPRFTGAYHRVTGDNEYVENTDITMNIWVCLNIIEVLCIVSLILFSGAVAESILPHIFIVLISILLKSYAGSEVFKSRYFNTDKIKQDIVIHEVVSVFAYIIAISTFTGAYTSLALIAGSVIWGLAWQRLMYGKMFYFP